jgi:ubiquitin-conjugating enzyme E2 O
LAPLQRLTRLYDGLDQLEDMFEGGFSEEGSLMEDILPGGEEWLDGPATGISSQLMWTNPMIEVGEGTDTRKGGADVGEEGEISDAMILNTVDDCMSSSELDPPRLPGGLPIDDVSTTPQIFTTPVPPVPSTRPLTSQPLEPPRDSENDDLYWKRFDVLPSAPTDHAFYDRPVPQPSRAFMGRIHKEYRALSTGLPGALLLVSVTNSNAGFLAYQPRFSYGHMRTEGTFYARSSSVQKTLLMKMPPSSSTGC